MVRSRRGILNAGIMVGILIFIGMIITLSILSSGVQAEQLDDGSHEVTVAFAPKLSIESVDPEKYEVERNEHINVTVIVRNDGDEDATNVDVSYEKDGTLQYFQTIANIPPGSRSSLNFSFSESNIGEYELTYTGSDDGEEFGEKSINITVIGPTHYVDDDAPEGGDGSKERPYNEVQEAIDNALPGDTIRVFEGTYFENVQIDKTLSVIGNGSSNTTIDGEVDGVVVTISSDRVNLSGFSVINCGRDDSCILVQSDFNTLYNLTCSVNPDYYPEMEAGIFLDRCNWNTIIDNVLTNCTVGLRMTGSFSNSVRGNEFSKNMGENKRGYDLYITGSDNNLIEGNDFQKMYMYQSHTNNIEENTCTDNIIELYMSESNILTGNTLMKAKIEIDSSDKCTLENNICTPKIYEHCILLRSSDNITMAGNSISYGGITIWGRDIGNWNTHTIDSSNTVNGDEVYYLTNTSGFEVPDGMGQVILANCSNGLIDDQEYINVSGGIIIGYSSYLEISDVTSSENYYGAYIKFSNNLMITNSEFSKNYYGVAIEDSRDIEFTGNNCSNNGNSGIDLDEVYYSTIRNNQFHSNAQSGIGGGYRVEWSVIEDNICNDNRDGIRIEMSYDPALIRNNICSNNRFGIYLPDARYITVQNLTCEGNFVGIYIRDSNIINMTNLTIFDSEYAGVYFRGAWDCSLNYSSISDCFSGILLSSDSYNISAQYNNIWDNSEYGANASDNDDISNDYTLNWWGDGSGPYHEDDNPDGEGDHVTDFIEFDPWLPRKVLPLTADFSMSPYFDTGLIIDDTNDPIENGVIDVFYGDEIVFQELATYPGDDPLTFEWTFHCDSSKYETADSGEEVHGVVGVDFLYEGLDGADPIISRNPVNYTVSLSVSDGVSTVSVDYTIRVLPYAVHEFTKSVKIGNTLLDASVTLTWRGFVEEAAPQANLISPDRPVFVYIEVIDSPDEDIQDKGGVGLVYDLRSVGCRLQNGDEGFIEAEINLPFLTSDLENIGDAFSLQDDLRLEYYDEELERFLVVDESRVVSDGGIKYVQGTVDHFSIFTGIVDSLYNSSHPNHLTVLPDLSVIGIEFSRSSAIDGQEIEIRVGIKNTGITHGKNVWVTFYDGDYHIGDMILDSVESSGGRANAMIKYVITLNNPQSEFEEHIIRIIVNEDQTIEEGPLNYGNNEKQDTLMVIALQDSIPSPQIRTPEDESTVEGIISIEGNILYSDTVVTLIMQPFGNNDYAWHVEKMVPSPVPIEFVQFSLIDDDGEIILGGNGNMMEIYSMNYDDPSTTISFQDNDRDGMISAGDVFLVKNVVNGGIASEEDSFEFEYFGVDDVQLSIDYGEWILVEGTDPWTYEWDTLLFDNGDHSLLVQAISGTEFSEISMITLTVYNPPDNSPPSITITSPMNFSVVSGTISINGLADDEDGTVERVEILIHHGSWQVVPVTASWTYLWNTKDLENGDYVVLVRSFDGTDYSPEVSLTVTVDNKEDKDDDDGTEIAGIDALIFVAILIVVMALMVGGVILRTRTDSRVIPPAPRKKFSCPICKGPASYNKEKKRWMCHRCKKFIQPVTPPSRPAVKPCPTCGEEAAYTEEYGDYYCWNCEEYLSDLED